MSSTPITSSSLSFCIALFTAYEEYNVHIHKWQEGTQNTGNSGNLANKRNALGSRIRKNWKLAAAVPSNNSQVNFINVRYYTVLKICLYELL